MANFADNVVRCLVTASLLLSLLPAVPASAASFGHPGYQTEAPTLTPEPASETPTPAANEAEELPATDTPDPTETATSPPETATLPPEVPLETATAPPPPAETATPAPTDTPIPTFTPKPAATLRTSADEETGWQVYLPLVWKAALPQAAFSSSRLAGPAPLAVTFVNSSTHATRLVWDFGDGSAPLVVTTAGDMLAADAAGQPLLGPTHVYSQAGVYTVTLQAGNGVVTATLTQANYITPFQLNVPRANFAGTPLAGARPLTITFANLSSGAGEYVWDFGDTLTGTAISPSHVYTQAGVYTVSLLARAGVLSDVLTRTAYITVTEGITADFSAFPLAGPAPLAVQFLDGSSGAESYRWDFGETTVEADTMTGSRPSPTHTYTLPGVYTVTLTTADGATEATETKPGYISVTEPVVPGFRAEPLTGTVPLTVTFHHDSTGAADYIWDFGTGATLTVISPTYTYHDPGVYTVTLTAIGPGGRETVVQPHYITAYAPVSAAFEADNLTGTAPLTITFSNHSTNATVYAWDFGDGSGSTVFSPTYIYTQAGVYTVTLTAGNDSLTDTMTAQVRPVEPVVAGFRAEPVTGTAPLTITFSNNSANTTAYLWDFGDTITSTVISPTHIYTRPGIYTVTLVAGNSLVTGTLTRTGYITASGQVAADFTASVLLGTAPLTVTFANSSTQAGVYRWDFGDGSGGSTAISPTHLYTRPGVYTVTLAAGDGVLTGTLIKAGYIEVIELAPPGTGLAAPSAGGLLFIENAGQFDPNARFMVRGSLGSLYLADDALWFTVLESLPEEDQKPGKKEKLPHERATQPRRGVNFKVSFPGANPHARIEPFNRLETTVSYFIGSDPDGWRPDVPVWGGVRYVDFYPGVDLELSGQDGELVQRLVVRQMPDVLAPRAGEDWGKGVRMRLGGADSLALERGQTLRLSTAIGDFSLPLLQAVDADGSPLDLAPASPQVTGDEISAPFAPASTASAPGGARRAAGRAAPLPLSLLVPLAEDASDLVYSSFLGGGSGPECGYGIAVDSSRSVYVTGYTHSSDFPTKTGSFDTSFSGGDTFVTKVNSGGTAPLVYSAFLGGDGWEYGYGIAVDSSGNAYVTGDTSSDNFPRVNGIDSILGSGDAFLTKVNSGGTALSYSFRFGGSSYDYGTAIAVDSSGNAYVTGYTQSSNFSRKTGSYDTSYNGGNSDAFVIKVNSSGTGLVYGTFLGGGNEETGWGIAVDSSGDAYVTGYTHSSDFPTKTGSFDRTYGGGIDALATKVNSSGTGLVYSTFLGGSGYDHGYDIAVDSSGNVYVTGLTCSSSSDPIYGFPTTTGSFDTSFDGDSEAFVTKVNSSGTGLAYSTYLGGSDNDAALDITVDVSDYAYVTGQTNSADFPLVNAYDTSLGGGSDAFVTKVNSSGTDLAYSTFLGGSSYDRGYGIAVDSSGNAYVTGYTYSADFPLVHAFDASLNDSDSDAFISKLALGQDQNLVYNPGFENGATGWSEVAEDSTSFWRWTWGPAAPHSGSYGYSIGNYAYGVLVSDPIIITASTSYSLTAYVRGQIDPDTSQGGWIIRAWFYRTDDSYISAQDAASGGIGSLSTSWAQKGNLITPPANAAKMRIRLYNFLTSGWVAFDDVSLKQVGQSTNLVPNPGFEEGAAGWSKVTEVGDSTSFWAAAPRTGSYGYSIGNLAYGALVSDPITVSPGTSYDLTAWMRGQIDPDTQGVWLIRALFYTAGGSYISAQDAASGGVGSLDTGWTAKEGTITTPVNTARVRIRLYNYLTSGWVAFDDVSLIQAGPPSDEAITGLAATNNSPKLINQPTTLTATVTAGSNVVYNWDFGDGSASGSGAVVSHVYTNPGAYTAVVRATNSASDVSASTTVNIYSQVVANFTASPLTGTVSLTVTFSNSSSGATDYLWNFGDGTTSTVISPTHVYTQAGVYTVSLRASNPASSHTLARTGYITVTDSPIDGLVAINDSPTLLGQTTTFTTTISAGSNVSYDWAFGDGQSGSGAVVTHTYSQAGAYTAVVTASNPASVVTATTAVTITGAAGLAISKTASASAVAGEPVTYTLFIPNSGAGPAANLLITDTLPISAHYVSGGDLAGDVVSWTVPSLAGGEAISVTFTVTAATTITNSDYAVTADGGISAVGQEVVTTEVYPPAIPDFSAEPLTGTVPLSVTFTNISSGATGYLWDFGDSITDTVISPTHVYTRAGVYTVTLTAFSPVDSDTLTRTDYISAYAPIDVDFIAEPLTGTAPLTITFSYSSTTATDYLWGFGDGVTLSLTGTLTGTALTSTHTYTQAGVYTVTLAAGNGVFTDTLTRTHYITAFEPLNVDFSASPLTGTAPLTVTFTNSSTGASSYLWDFGDGSTLLTTSSITDTVISPTHVYTLPGVYTVTLTITGTEETKALTRPAYIEVFGADFMAVPQIGPAPLAVTFTDILSDRVESRLWDFGDGSTLLTAGEITETTTAGISTTHVYTRAGVYTPTLTVVRGGYVYTATRSAYITARGAEFEAAPPSGLSPLSVTFTDLVSAPVTYRSWDFGDGSAPWITTGLTDTTASITATHLYTRTGVYSVTLVVERDGYTYTHTMPELILVSQPACGITTTQTTWWDGRFFYRQPVTLTVAGQLDYTPGITQVIALTLDTESLITDSLMLPGGEDLRIVYHDATGWRDLPRHLEGLNSANTTVYFPLQATIAVTDTGYYLYYGHVAPGEPPELYQPVEGAPTITTSGSGTFTPTVAFTASTYAGLAPLNVTFTNLTTPTSGVTGYSWSFGDGGTSSAASPGYTYDDPGVYTVGLTAQTTEGLEVAGTWPGAIQVPGLDATGQATAELGERELPVSVATICAGWTAPQSFTSADGRLTVTFPPGAVQETIVVTHTPYLASVSQGPDSLSRFILSASTLDGTAVTQFAKPVDLALDHTTFNLTPQETETLLFFKWNEPEQDWTAFYTTIAQATAHISTDRPGEFIAAQNFGLGGPPPLRRLPSVNEAGVDLLTGSATYVHPLEVPPGTHGMQPNLSLVYNSGAADTLLDQQAGIIGHGFELAGLGWIQRNPEDEHYYLNLNGVSEKLLPKGDNSVYHTEHETFWRIERKEGGAEAKNGIDYIYWLVTTGDGTRYEFGNTPQSTARYIEGVDTVGVDSYHLNEIRDVYNNLVTITYTKQVVARVIPKRLSNQRVEYDEAVIPEIIAYTSNPITGLNPDRYIYFDYDNLPPDSERGNYRLDKPIPYLRGVGQNYGPNQRLEQIRAEVDGNPVRSYVLSQEYYTQDEDKSGSGDTPSDYGPNYYHLMLTGVTEYGTGGEASLPTTSFSYASTGHLENIDNHYGGRVSYHYEPVVAYRENSLYVCNDMHCLPIIEYWREGTDTDRWRVNERVVIGSDLFSSINYVYGYEYKPALFRNSKFIGHQEVKITLPDGSKITTHLSLGKYDTPQSFENFAPDRERRINYSREALWGKPVVTWIRAQDGELLSQTDIFYEYRSIEGVDGVSFTAPEKVVTVIGDGAPIETEYEYDDFGNVESILEKGDPGLSSDGRKTVVQYKDKSAFDGRVTNRPEYLYIYDESGTELLAQTNYAYEGGAALESVTTTQVDVSGHNNPDLASYIHFDTHGNVDETWTGDESRQVTIQYDNIHHTYPKQVRYPYSFVEEYDYDPGFGFLKSVTDLNGVTTVYTPDAFGRLKTESGANGLISYDYNDDDQPSVTELKITITYHGDPAGGEEDDYQVEQVYNGLGQLVKTVTPGDPQPTVAHYRYDSLGRPIGESVPDQNGQPTTNFIGVTAYDGLGRPLTLKTLDGQTSYTYPSWNAVHVDDPLNAPVAYGLDAFGRVTTVTEADNGPVVTRYEYNFLGQLAKIIDTGDNETVIGYDSLGRKRTMQDPDMGAWSYSYDTKGDLVTQVDARGITTTLTYDNLARLTGKSYEIPQDQVGLVAATAPITYLYETSFQRTGMIDGSGTTAWQYDNGRLKSETKEIDGYPAPLTTGYAYDAFGRLATMTYPDNEVITYTYKAGDLIETVQSNNNDGTLYLSEATYNPLGQPRTQKLANSVIQREIVYTPDTYRPWTQHITASETSLQSLNFNFDALGRLTAYDDLSHAVDLDYEDYDPLNRIKQVSGTYQQTYDYDNFGNLTLHRDLIYRYGRESEPFHAPDRVETGGDEPSTLAWFDYDLNGNLTKKTIEAIEDPITYTYDAENRLTQMVSGTVTTTFTYDGDGQQVRRIAPGGETTFYAGQHYQVAPGIGQGSWSEISPVLGPTGNNQGAPRLFSDANGTLYLVWVEYTSTGSEIRFARRTGAGIWENSEPVRSVSSWCNLNDPVVVADTSGQVTVAWGEYCSDWPQENVMIRQRDIAGQWSSNEFVDSGRYPALAVHSDGTIYLALENIDNVYVHSKQPDGYWSDGFNSADNAYRPALAVDNQDHLYLSYVSPSESTRSVYVERYEDPNWEQPEQVGDSPNSDLSALAVDSQDNVFVAWLNDNVLVKKRWATTGNWYLVGDDGSNNECGTLALTVDSNGTFWYATIDCKYEIYRPLAINGSEIGQQANSPTLAAGSGGTVIAIWQENQGRLYQSIHSPAASVTKRYFAGSQQLALSIGDELYYTLPDPTGTSLLLADSAGNEAGHILYDPYGGVLTSTIPATLTTALAGAPDPATGLVHLGNGRWYDPAMGRPLQPNPVGGAPIVPQSLNRYAATPVGQPGVAEGAVEHLDPLVATTWKGLLKTALSTVTGSTRQRTLNVAIQSLLASTIGRSQPTGRSFVQLMGEPEAFTGIFAHLRVLRSDSYSLPPQGCLGSLWQWLLRRPSTVQIDLREGFIASTSLDDLPKNLGLISSEPELISPGWMKVAPGYIGTFIWGGALSGVVQHWSDVGNPYLTQRQLWARTGFATVGGGATTIIGAIATAKIGGALGIPAGPPTMILGGVVGFSVGFVYFGFLQPVIFNWIGQNSQHNLAPLSSP